MKKIVHAKDKDILEETKKLSSFTHSGRTSVASLLTTLSTEWYIVILISEIIKPDVLCKVNGYTNNQV